MFFVIPEMPSKTFVMLYKKLPDHFKEAAKKVLSFVARPQLDILKKNIMLKFPYNSQQKTSAHP